MLFARFSRLPLRRCLHSSARHTNHSNPYRLTFGASALVAATYVTWRLTHNANFIALDSKLDLPSVQKPVTPSNDKSIEPVEPKTTSHITDIEPSSDVQDQSTPDDDDDAAAGGAFNPVTGEINWDCPCLGGMAHGPCGPEFREAFSCFVFSEEEPKGINCVEKFKGMQDCFRAHPETYGDEIMDDDDEEEELAPSAANPIPEGATVSSSGPVQDRHNPVPVSKHSADPTTQHTHRLGSSTST